MIGRCVSLIQLRLSGDPEEPFRLEACDIGSERFCVADQGLMARNLPAERIEAPVRVDVIRNHGTVRLQSAPGPIKLKAHILLGMPAVMDKESKIERNATDPAAEEAAATLVRDAIILAEAETLSFFDEDERAAEILKSMLKDECRPASEGEPPEHYLSNGGWPGSLLILIATPGLRCARAGAAHIRSASTFLQRLIFPFTVIAEPASVSPRTAWIFWYSPSGKKTYPLSVPLGGIVVGFSDKLWICCWARSSAAAWA
jgi:hypothetical protein